MVGRTSCRGRIGISVAFYWRGKGASVPMAISLYVCKLAIYIAYVSTSALPLPPKVDYSGFYSAGGKVRLRQWPANAGAWDLIGFSSYVVYVV